MRAIPIKAALGAVACVLVGTTIARNVEEVDVQAKRALNVNVVGRTSSGVPMADVSLNYDVSVAGLDLASNAGAAELEKRIGDAARAACREIGRQYPDATPTDAECAKAAAGTAMVKARELIALAHTKAASK